MGLSNTAATIPGFVMPALAGAVATSKDKHTLQEQWRVVFFISTGILLFGAIFYGIFASGESRCLVDTGKETPPTFKCAVLVHSF